MTVAIQHPRLNIETVPARQVEIPPTTRERYITGIYALNIEPRGLKASRGAGGVVWFALQDLCGGPRSQNDYLELATRFHTIVLSDVPHMPVRLASEARRFTWLVDVLYDRKVKLVISAEVPPEQLYTEGPLSHEFPRTVSRLNEMQSKEYLSEEKRNVDTSLT